MENHTEIIHRKNRELTIACWIVWHPKEFVCHLLIAKEQFLSFFFVLITGERTHSMKVTTYAPPFLPPFFRPLENLYSFDPYISAKIMKMLYFHSYFLSKFDEMYSFDPPFWPLVAFWVNMQCWASLSETQLRTPTPWFWPYSVPSFVHQICDSIFYHQSYWYCWWFLFIQASGYCWVKLDASSLIT